MAKGEGKGGCEGTIDAVQSVVICACCSLAAGPVLIIVGVLFVLSAFHNTRGRMTDDYNAAVRSWHNGNVEGWAQTNASSVAFDIEGTCGTLESRALVPSSSPEDLGHESGNGDLKRYTIHKLVSPDPERHFRAEGLCNATFILKQADGSVVAEVTAPATGFQTHAYDDLCNRSKSNKSNKVEPAQQEGDIERCASSCKLIGGQSNGTTYENFTCNVEQYLKTVCIRVKRAVGTTSWVSVSEPLPGRSGAAAAKGAGCFQQSAGVWSTTEYEQQANVSSFPDIIVRHQLDPYLYFIDITGGSLNFGLSIVQKLAIGLSLLSAGVVISLCLCVACSFVCHHARIGHSTRPTNPVSAVLFDVGKRYSGYMPGANMQVIAPTGSPPFPIYTQAPFYGQPSGAAKPSGPESSYGSPYPQPTVHPQPPAFGQLPGYAHPTSIGYAQSYTPAYSSPPPPVGQYSKHPQQAPYGQPHIVPHGAAESLGYSHTAACTPESRPDGHGARPRQAW